MDLSFKMFRAGNQSVKVNYTKTGGFLIHIFQNDELQSQWPSDGHFDKNRVVRKHSQHLRSWLKENGITGDDLLEIVYFIRSTQRQRISKFRYFLHSHQGIPNTNPIFSGYIKRRKPN
jgi:hypothetical protein